MKTRFISLALKLRLGLGKELADVFLTRTHILAQHLRAVHNLWLACIQHLTNLPRHERLTCTWRAVQHNTLDVLDTQLIDQIRWENARRKRTSENGAKLSVETTDTHVLKLEVGLQNRIRTRSLSTRFDLQRTAIRNKKVDLRLWNHHTHVMRGTRVHRVYASHRGFQVLAVELKYEHLIGRQDVRLKHTHKDRLHLISTKWCHGHLAPTQKVQLNIETAQVHALAQHRRLKSLDHHIMAFCTQARPLPLQQSRSNGAWGNGVSIIRDSRKGEAARQQHVACAAPFLWVQNDTVRRV